MKINLQTISSKLVLGGVTAVLVPLVIVGYLSFSKAKTALMDLSKDQARGIASDLARTTHMILEDEIDKASSMASQKSIIDLSVLVKNNGIESSGDRIQDVFKALKTQFRRMGDHYQGVFIADTTGKIYTGVLDNGDAYENIDIANSEFFQRARQDGKTVISEMTLSKATGKPVVTACAPILAEGGAFTGVLGTVIQAGYFTDVISGRKIGKTGYGYMIDQKGLIIAHPNPDFILELDATSIKEMAAINKKMMAGDTGVEALYLQRCG